MTDRGELEELQQKLGYRFRDPDRLRLALTHRSWSHEHDDGTGNYERFEFLGDAVLGFVVSETLYRQDAEADEGCLTRRKQLVVRSSTLARAARDLGLGRALRLSRGEAASGGAEKRSLLADAFEALVGAVYLDGGIRAARTFVRRHLRGPLREAGRSAVVADDFKTRLQERTQGRLRVTPAYRTVRESGPEHEKWFRAEVSIGRRILGRGEGSSHRRAEQAAARQALAVLDREEGEC